MLINDLIHSTSTPHFLKAKGSNRVAIHHSITHLGSALYYSMILSSLKLFRTFELYSRHTLSWATFWKVIYAGESFWLTAPSSGHISFEGTFARVIKTKCVQWHWQHCTWFRFNDWCKCAFVTNVPRTWCSQSVQWLVKIITSFQWKSWEVRLSSLLHFIVYKVNV